MCLSREEKLILIISGSSFPLSFEKKQEIIELLGYDAEEEDDLETLLAWGIMAENMLAITGDEKNQSETFCL